MGNIPFAIIGGGGHSKVVISALIACNEKIFAVFEDDESKTNHLSFANIRIQKTPTIEWWDHHTVNTILAIGSNRGREKIAQKLPNIIWGKSIHPTAVIHESSIIGDGTYIGANVVIQPDVIIGNHCIINTGAIIEHDVVVGNYCHIAPGSILTGHVKIGVGTLIGAGTTIIPEIIIGEWCIIGAGSVVIRDIKSFQKAYGNPFKVLNIES